MPIEIIDSLSRARRNRVVFKVLAAQVSVRYVTAVSNDKQVFTTEFLQHQGLTTLVLGLPTGLIKHLGGPFYYFYASCRGVLNFNSNSI